MQTEADELKRILLWLLLTGGLVALLFYGLASFVAPPAAETITTDAPALKSNGSPPGVKFGSPKFR